MNVKLHALTWDVNDQLHAPATLPLGRNSRFRFDRKLGGPQSKSGRGGCTENRIPVVQLVMRYHFFSAITHNNKEQLNCLSQPYCVPKDYACISPRDYPKRLQTFVWAVHLIQWVKWVLSLGVKWPGREPPTSPENNNLILHIFVFGIQWARMRFTLTLSGLSTKMCCLKRLEQGFVTSGLRTVCGPLSHCAKDVSWKGS